MQQTPNMLQGVRLDKPSPARMYDYFLGGYQNFEIDRIAADNILAIYPDGALGARANRAFLRRVVKFCLSQQIDQFLDLGSGIPTVGNVHEIVREIEPNARVVYVDIDPVAVNHSHEMLRHEPHTAIVQADIRQPEQLLQHSDVVRLLDFSRPVAILLVAVLHFIGDDQQAQTIARQLQDAFVPGSYVAISHLSFDEAPREVVAQIDALYAGSTNPTTARNRQQITQLFDGLSLIDPGVTLIPLWRPETPDDIFLDQPARCLGFAGVGKIL